MTVLTLLIYNSMVKGFFFSNISSDMINKIVDSNLLPNLLISFVFNPVKLFDDHVVIPCGVVVLYI